MGVILMDPAVGAAVGAGLHMGTTVHDYLPSVSHHFPLRFFFFLFCFPPSLKMWEDKLRRLPAPCSHLSSLYHSSFLRLPHHQPLSRSSPPSLLRLFLPPSSVSHWCTSFTSTTFVMWLPLPPFVCLSQWLDTQQCLVSSSLCFFFFLVVVVVVVYLCPLCSCCSLRGPTTTVASMLAV